MSFKFKLKVKTGGTGDGAAPTSSQPSAGGAPQQPGQDLYAAPSQQWPIEPAGDPLAGTASQALAPAPSKPMKFKLKVASGAGQAPAAPVEHQWDAPPAAPPPRVKREAPDAAGDEAGAAPAARPIKKIKLTTGKAAGVPVGKKPLIRFKPPAKQPCDAAAAAAVDATAGGGATARGATLPIVRLTLSAVGAPAGGGVRRPKAKALKPKPGLKAGGGVKKAKVRTAKGAGLSPEGGAKRAKRSRSELKELRDLGIDDFEDYDPDVPVAPRTFHLRSSHAAAAPSSTGLGASGGGPAPSDARTGGGGGVADTAGTATPPGDGPASWPQVAAARGAGGAPRKEDFERLLARCQKKDVHSMFKEPVTEAIAPGYFAVIQRPMDFSTMRAKAQRGEYASWDGLRADMRLMFTNALTYNAQGGTVHNYAKLLMGQCDRIVELAMQGKTDFRSSASITRKHNAAVKAQQRAEREALRAQARRALLCARPPPSGVPCCHDLAAEQRAAQEAKVLKKAGLASSYDEHEDENIRNSYRRPVRDGNVAKWRGLGGGSSAEGVAWGPGRQVLRPVNPWLPPGMYALSLARFAAGLKGKARDLVRRRALASSAADEAAERALQQELAKKVPLPPPPPAPAAAAPSAASAAAAAAGNRFGAAAGMAQQQTAMQAALGAASAAAGSAAAVAAAPATMLAQQQMMMQAAAGKQGMMGMAPGAMLARPGGQGLPPGATITLMATPQGMVPFLIQPGQQPIMMMAPGMMPGGAAGAGQKLPGGMPGGMMPGMQQGMFMPGMMQQQQQQQPSMRPKQ
ncbi:hypothetical protein CHLNCDRAFT_136360 [Chlorella variabilis]|uniref:Bromo domain-containing protein n=1 Tax=Chlorella variabilis TaxID=554065 RepID=E1ZK73_CHLVA|nr:hypothetical protein CHLNCDRAFT_136360 [Chlorella variabilis]EFN53753.1 hypothetical protein CHLNCDRAFT_136360 [Chlorella variabilis]|eukprot:XP_005845855.1 hypothetical protein CHLNCDRAFT_136360 [Chlorella variabilis]